MADIQPIEMESKSADDIIRLLGLEPHPEGGHFRQTWIADDPGRPSGTCIYFLLSGGESSHWHRVDAAEIWHHYVGAPLVLSIAASPEGPAMDHLLGPDLFEEQRPQIIVPTLHWQAARSTGDWSLVGCSVSPAFHFEGFTLAPPGFDIPRAN